MFSIMVVRNWCRTNSFSGRSCAVGQAREPGGGPVDLVGGDRSRSPARARRRRCIRHSGSSASPTLGCCSAQAHRLATALKSERPGWMSSSSSAPLRVRGPDVALDHPAGDVVAEVAVRAGARIGHRHDHLVDRRDRLARTPERGGRTHQPPVHHRRWPFSQHAQGAAAAGAVVGHQEPVAVEDPAPAVGEHPAGCVRWADPAGGRRFGRTGRQRRVHRRIDGLIEGPGLVRCDGVRLALEDPHAASEQRAA